MCEVSMVSHIGTDLTLVNIPKLSIFCHDLKASKVKDTRFAMWTKHVISHNRSRATSTTKHQHNKNSSIIAINIQLQFHFIQMKVLLEIIISTTAVTKTY